MSEYKTLKKYTDNIPNEDSCYIRDDMIAISDGAGGCGVFSSEWSKYLVNKIAEMPLDNPIVNFEHFDNWIEDIWEPFYNEHEEKAKGHDGIFQTKFYQEGSYATLAVAWKPQTAEDICSCFTYGDSVVFHYSKSKNILEHSFTKLEDFSNPPYLISCKDPLEEEGFRHKDFILEDDSIVFAASDALSHYILMMYYVTHQDNYKDEIKKISEGYDTNTQMLKIALAENYDDFDKLMIKFQTAARDQELFNTFVKDLHQQGLLEIDDYTLAILKFDDTVCNTL